MNDTNKTITYDGGCHCGAVRFQAESAPIESVMECNCSHCEKKGLLLTFIPRSSFTLVQGADQLSEYSFNRGTIKHFFCKICGTQPFAYGADNDGNELACLNVRCIDDLDLVSVTKKPFDGKNM